MSKKSLINKKALRYIIANSNLCKHAIRELELAGYGKEEDGPNKWMREQVIEAVALFSSHGNSGFSAPFEINLVKKLYMVLAWYLSKRTVDDFKGLVRRVQSGKFKPNKKNRELWDRFIDYFDIKNAKF